MAESYRERAERGAALLDKLMPSWFKKVDLDTLKLSSCTDCVCGQIARNSALPYFRVKRRWYRRNGYGSQKIDWTVALSWLNAKTKKKNVDVDSYEHGFVAYSNYGYHQLDKEWGRIVRERLEAEARS